MEWDVKFAADLLVYAEAMRELLGLEGPSEKQTVLCEERKAVFDKFHRVGNEQTRSQKGTGLGLYIVKEICKAHNAEITIGDNSPRGSRFQITFSKKRYFFKITCSLF
jgi:K+-sensing histidine kinase KdpD